MKIWDMNGLIGYVTTETRRLHVSKRSFFQCQTDFTW